MYISKSVKQSFDTKNECCPLGHILSSSGTFLNMSARAFLPPLKCKNFSETGIGWLANSTKELWRLLNDGEVEQEAHQLEAKQLVTQSDLSKKLCIFFIVETYKKL